MEITILPFFHKLEFLGSYRIRPVFLFYVDDIFLATNNKGLLCEVKQFLSKNFDMKDMERNLMSLVLRSIEKDLEAL